MSKTQIPIYATPEDWLNLVASVSSKRSLKLVKMGLFATPIVEVLDDPRKLEPFAGYLVLDKASEVSTRAIAQRNGDIKHAVDQLDNASSVVLNVGGMADHERLVAGQLGTVRAEQAAQELYTLFAREIKKQFVKVKSYYVGPQALRLLDAGARLTPTRKSPQEYDLVR
jgi:hypothetical protein